MTCPQSESGLYACSMCMDNYGLRGGACIKCGNGKFIAGDQECQPSCNHIPYCLECMKDDSSDVRCTKCEDPYDPSDDGQSCIQRTCLDDDEGCLECATNDTSICTKCRGDLVLINGHCDCEGGDDISYDENYKCFNTTCSTQIDHCEVCRNGNQCIYCDDGFVAENGVCAVLNCGSKISNCNECYFGYPNTFICETCEKGYVTNSDKTQCVQDIEVDCSLPGCLKCQNGNLNKCTKCDTDNGFKLSGNRCTCSNDDYDLIGNICYPPIPPVQPIEEAPVNIIEGQFTTDGGAGNKTFALDAEKLNQSDYLSIPSNFITNDVKFVNVETGFEKVEIKAPSRNEQLTILPTTAKLNIACDDFANLVLPQESSNINLTGNGVIDLQPSTSNAKSINLQKVSPQQGGDMTLTSDEADINIKEIQVFGSSTFTGQNDGKKTTCERVDLEGRSEFTPRFLNLKDLRIGLLAVFNMKYPNITFEDNSKIDVFYNRTLGASYGSHFPILISGKEFPDLSKAKIYIQRINSNETLPNTQEEDGPEEYNIARIEDQGSLDDMYQHCLELKEKFEGGEGFDNSNCINETNSKQEAVNLVAIKSGKEKNPDDKDKGLSAGAIAGIVIACVVVVAAIIALLVYFLVIKKRNQSTTSTQGDSSIAI